MKELLQRLLGGAVDVTDAIEGEGRDALDTIKGTAKMLLLWAIGSMLFLGVGIFFAGSSMSKMVIVGSWLFSTIMLGAIIWHAGVVAMTIALLSTAGDELLGEKFPNIEPKTVMAYVRQAFGAVVWVEFIHLVTFLLPASAWQSKWAAVSALIALTAIGAMALAGWFSGTSGRWLVKLTAIGFVLFFVGRNIPGVSDYVGSVSQNQVRKLNLRAAKQDLEGLPDDLLGRKMAELATLQKSAINRCGKLACNEQDHALTAKLEGEMAGLQSGNSAPGEIEESDSTESLPEGITYGEHTLPPPPAE